jgi:hypothetical protein
MCRKLKYLVSFVLVLGVVLMSPAEADDTNLVGWWKFDETSRNIAYDSSGHDNHGSLRGDPQLVAGKIGGALEFDGSGDYVDCGNNVIFDVTDEVTVAAWVNIRTVVGDWRTIIAKGDSAWRISSYQSTRRMHFAFTDEARGWQAANSDTVLPLNEWHHVCGTYDRQVGGRIYIDGVEDGVNSDTGGITTGPYNVYIGENSQVTNRWWDGFIDDVRVYNRALTQNEIQVIMQGEEFPYAFSPTPPDGSVLADTNVTLSWSPGHYAVSHDIYFGENFDDVNDGAEGTFRGNRAETFFIAGFPGFPYPDGLVPGTTYYWRIDEVNDTEPKSPWKGNVWRFLIPPNAAYATGHFAITYYDNYNYDTGQWDAWQSAATPQDAWDDKYLADGSSGNTVYTDHAFTSITAFDLRGGLFSKDGHASGGDDWNPLQSIGDNVSGQSAHHVFAALFKGLIYLEEGDNLMVASDDDVYVFLDGDTAWGQEVLSIPSVSHFGTDSMTVTAAQEGYHTITVKYIERLNDHSGIEITVNGVHFQNAKVIIDIKPGSYPLSEALDTILSFTTGGSADWFSQTTTTRYDGDAAQSGDISHRQDSWMQTTVSGTGTVKFYWMVSSEEDFDFLEFYIDGSLQEKISGSDGDWERQTYTISTSGSHTLEWRYMKDGSGNVGSDCGWVDKVEWVTN